MTLPPAPPGSTFSGGDGQTAYQELVGQSDNSVALGVPTGLPNGIVEQFPLFVDGVVAVTDDVVDGRPTWRIDRDYGPMNTGSDGPSPTESIWIDVATGVTLQRQTVGMRTSNDIPITDTVTLSGLDTNATLPAEFPGTFPDGAVVAPSGDPSAFGPTTFDEVASEFGGSIVVPSLPADAINVWRMNFGNADGTSTISSNLIVRWYDGFIRTEYRVVGFPPSMEMPDTCSSCTGSLLDELRTWNGETTEANVTRDQVGLTVTGPSREAIQEVIDSLVDLPSA